MTSIWFPNNKYPPNTKNYLPCFVLGGGLVLGGRDYYIYIYLSIYLWNGRPLYPSNIFHIQAPKTVLKSTESWRINSEAEAALSTFKKAAQEAQDLAHRDGSGTPEIWGAVVHNCAIYPY